MFRPSPRLVSRLGRLRPLPRRTLSRRTLACTVSALSLAIAAALPGSASAQDGAQTLPGAQILPGGRWTGARLPTVAQTNNGLVMTIKQEQKAALLDWSRLDVAKNEEIRFEQDGVDWIALNRIFSQDPTRIAGKITAKGQVWLQNTNGIVFQSGSQVNVHTILATSHTIADTVLTTTGLTLTDGVLQLTNIKREKGDPLGDIVIERGATLTAKSDRPDVLSRVMLFGANIDNQGRIEAVDGRVLAATGDAIRITRSATTTGDYIPDEVGQVIGRVHNAEGEDIPVRDDLDNWIDYQRRAEAIGMRVTNGGEILAGRGQIFLTGREINQNGLLQAHSGVGQRSGIITLDSRYSVRGTESGGVFDYGAVTYAVGRVNLARGSVTAVDPLNSDLTAPALESRLGSQIYIRSGGDIVMEGGSLVRANGGRVQMTALDWTRRRGGQTDDVDENGNRVYPVGNRGGIFLQDGAVIDVSGLRDVAYQATDNILEVEVRANELAPSPQQRDGVLNGQTVRVDRRVGTGLLDWTGALVNVQETARQKSTNGGNILLIADAQVVMDEGAVLDISGGSRAYAGGRVQTTQLVRGDGRIFDIAAASANDRFAGLVTLARSVDAYTEGSDAGHVNIIGPEGRLSGNIRSETVNSANQILGGLNGIKPLAPQGAGVALGDLPATRLAHGGTFRLFSNKEDTGYYSPQNVFIVPDNRTFTAKLGSRTADVQTVAIDPLSRFSSNPDLLRPRRIPLDAPLADVYAFPDAVWVIDDNFGDYTQKYNLVWSRDVPQGVLDFNDGASLTLDDGGEFTSQRLRRIGRNASLIVPSGTIDVTETGTAAIADGALLSVAGRWINDRLPGAGSASGLVDGGRMILDYANLEGRVTLDASGGGWYRQDSAPSGLDPSGRFSLVSGKGGDIKVSVGDESPQSFIANARFLTDGLAGSGSLTLTGVNIVIGGADAVAGTDPNTLYLTDRWINGLGVSRLNLGDQNIGRITAVTDALIGRTALIPIDHPSQLDQNTNRPLRLVNAGEVITAGTIAILREAGVGFTFLGTSARVLDGADINLASRQWSVTGLDRLATGGDLPTAATLITRPVAELHPTTLSLNGAFDGSVVIEDGASVTVASGGTINIGSQAADVRVNGDLTARGGRVDIATTGSVMIASSRIDVSGVAQSRVTDGGYGQVRLDGFVLQGGNVQIQSSRLDMAADSSIDVSGTSGVLTVPVETRLGTFWQPRTIGTDAGGISLLTGGGTIAADLKGAAGIDTSRAGSLVIRGPVVNRLASLVNDAEANLGFFTPFWFLGNESGATTLQELVAFYPERFPGVTPETVEPLPLDQISSIYTAALAGRADALVGTLALGGTAGSGAGSAPGGYALPEGYVLQTTPQAYDAAINALSRFAGLQSGSLSLTADALRSVARFDRLSLAAGRIQLNGDLSLAVRRQLTLEAGLVDGLGQSRLSAPYIELREAAAVTSEALSGRLTLAADVIQVGTGATAAANLASFNFGGFANVDLTARREIRGGLDTDIRATGDLTLISAQIYPLLGDFSIGSDRSITVRRSNAAAFDILAAGARLTLEAPVLTHDGVLRAPLGEIILKGEKINIGAGSVTSVAGDDKFYLYGTTQDNAALMFGPLSTNPMIAAPEKRVTINGLDVDVAEGALIDARGGGDILATEFIPGTTGRADILAQPGAYAIVPDIGENAIAPGLGESIELSAFDGRPSGRYTLLPAKYAVLPGAYLVTPLTGTAPGVSRRQSDDSFVVSGRLAVAGTGIIDNQASAWRLLKQEDLLKVAEYKITASNAFFTSDTFIDGLTRTGDTFDPNPRLAASGGSIELAAGRSLSLKGQIRATAQAGQRGGQIDISGGNIVIADEITDISDLEGYVRIDPKQLSNVAESVLIGGVRRQGASGVEIVAGQEVRGGPDLGAQNVVVRNSASSALTGPEILLAAREMVRVEDGSVIRAVGDGADSGTVRIRASLPAKPFDPNNGFAPPLAGEDRGAFVRVSNLGDAEIVRNSVRTDQGDVIIGSGARLEAIDAIALDATRDTQVMPGATLTAGALTLGSSTVSLGDTPEGLSGLVLNRASLDGLNSTRTLRLKSLSSIDVYGDVTLATKDALLLDAAGLLQRAGNTLTLRSDLVALGNSSGAVAEIGGAGQAINIDGKGLRLAAGDFVLDYARTDITIAGRARFEGSGVLRTVGDLTLAAADLTGSSGARRTLDSAGAIRLNRSEVGGLPALAAAGAALTLLGDSVTFDSRLTLNSGVIRATARSGDVELGQNAVLDVSGLAADFFDTRKFLPAGTVDLTALNGDFRMDSRASINVAAAADGGDAGSLIISAARGTAVLDGQIKAQARPGALGGSFSLNSLASAEFGTLAALLNDAGFSRSRNFAVATGDVVIDGVTQVDNFSLSTGEGSVRVAGTAQIVSQSAKGGNVLIASGSDLTVDSGALIDVSARSATGRGGRIDLQTGQNGSLDIAAANLNVSGGANGRAGEVKLRAVQTFDDVAVTRFDAIVTGGASILEAYSVTDLSGTDGVIDQGMQSQVIGDAAAFMARAANTIRTRLNQSDATRFTLTPGIEIRSTDSLTLADTWNLATARFDGVPGYLTLRAGGDLNLNAALSDGFLLAEQLPQAGSPDPAATATRLTNDRSWSFNLTGGADLGQTSVLAVRPNTLMAGDVNLNALVRTGTGSIDIAAAGDLNYKPALEWKFSKSDLSDETTFLPLLEITRPNGEVITVSGTQGPSFETIYDVPGLGQLIDLGSGQGVLLSRDGVQTTIGATLDADFRTGAKPLLNFSLAEAAVYTAGVDAPDVTNFFHPKEELLVNELGEVTTAYYSRSFLKDGGDITIKAGGNILGTGDRYQSFDWYGRRGGVQYVDTGKFDYDTFDRPFAPIGYDLFEFGRYKETLYPTGRYRQTAAFIYADRFRQGVGALGGGDISLSAGGNIDNLATSLPTTTRVSGGLPLADGKATPKVLTVDGGGDLNVYAGGDISRNWFWMGRGAGRVVTDGTLTRTQLVIDDATLDIRARGDLAILGFTSGGHISGAGRDSWLGLTERSSLDLTTLGGNLSLTGLEQQYITVLPSKVGLTAFDGSVLLSGQSAISATMISDNYADARFDILSRKDIILGNEVQLIIGRSDPEVAPRVLNPALPQFQTASALLAVDSFTGGGGGFNVNGGDNIHEDQQGYIRLYAAEGDLSGSPIPTSRGTLFTGTLSLGRETRIRVGGDLRILVADIYQHDGDDLSLIEAQGSIYKLNLNGYGTGRVWLQAGKEIYGYNYVTNEIVSETAGIVPENGISMSVLAGIDKEPAYAAFFDTYLTKAIGGDAPSYLSERFVPAENGLPAPVPSLLADGQTEVSIYAVDLVNYYRLMTGAGAQISLKDEKGANLLRGDLVRWIDKGEYDLAQAWFATLDPVKQRPLASQILFAELQVAGREAVGASVLSDPQKRRAGDPSRGYAAIASLFPGAQRRASEALADGESRWTGALVDSPLVGSDGVPKGIDVLSANGGGGIEVLIPGGFAQLVSLSVSDTKPEESGLTTQDGGAIRILTQKDYVVNQSRTLTADGGDILIWSSFGDIDAGKGRKSSLAIPPIVFDTDANNLTRIKQSGLPNGAGIASLDKVDGTPGGDVDLYAFNGIINAGDAGIRVSRDLFVGASEIRGLDNITVGGQTNVDLQSESQVGPLNLQNFAQAAEDQALEQALALSTEVEKLRADVQRVLTGRIINYGEDCDPQARNCNVPTSQGPISQRSIPASGDGAQLAQVDSPKLTFDIRSLPLDQAVRAVGRRANLNILYNSDELKQQMAPPLVGKMTAEEALSRLVARHGLRPVRISRRAITLNKG